MKVVADVGCGAGILSIFCAQNGAGREPSVIAFAVLLCCFNSH